ncbi:hypothetical protein BMW23_0425 [Bodo saltans virus]|uniref:Uncharacterized protein n=1 Tax=Bodo saltans virus TaxID=2024608 RepID=A0A2H4UUE9_9VIRU|nr:hypothetical protein QJ851_gp0414 [Bodo saltans virus]ATZ80477.1 hypothetical protein BMW23_0425 [Bodo saltans virus]
MIVEITVFTVYNTQIMLKIKCIPKYSVLFVSNTNLFFFL